MAGIAAKPLLADNVVRERLLKVATELFARKGYSATATREIVDAARVTKPVLYYYFRSKEGLYLELIQRAFKEFENVVDTSIMGSGSTEQKILRLCDQVFDLVLKKIEVVRLVYAFYYGPPQGAPFFDFDAVHQRLFEAIEQLVMEGMRKKELRETKVEDMVWAVFGALNITIENELCHPERELGHAGLRRILRLLFQGISTAKGRRRGEEK
ncbi:MAG TPA: TetR/AcrR family transcriptional regulator [Thermodesulfobacteriota bacterium]|nr:TetR/AcrR family transcriptional regulator [Thermodesulfobacteriota bacterium]